MNRRESLKTLGAFLISPSLVQLVERGPISLPPPDHVTKAAQHLRLFSDPLDVIRRYQSLLLGPNGETWAGPQVSNVNRHDKGPLGPLTLVEMQPLKAVETITVKGIRLLSPQREWRSDSHWTNGPVYMYPGDSINCNLSFTFSMSPGGIQYL